MMSATLELPIWLFVLITVFAVWSFLTLLLMPGFRWFVRNRVSRVIDDVHARLDLELPPFMLTRRAALIDRLVFDEKVMEAIAEKAAARDLPRQVVIEEAESYAREIVPGFNAYF